MALSFHATTAVAARTPVGPKRVPSRPVRTHATSHGRPYAIDPLTGDVVIPRTTGPPTGSVEKTPADAPEPTPAKPRKTIITVLGSGWGAVSFVRSLDPTLFGPSGEYELVVISPRDHFVYTPLLPAVASGSVKSSSITTPMLDIISAKGRFIQAAVSQIDANLKVLTCAWNGVQKFVDPSTGETSERDHVYSFQMRYDILIGAIGSKTATFGIPGVEEHAIMIKSADDSDRLRRRFEGSVAAASEDRVSPGERRRLMNVVVIGGGPTGVEVAAELQELIDDDFERLCNRGYCGAERPTITLVSNTNSLLMAFSDKASEYATKRLESTGVREMLGYDVTRVCEDGVEVTAPGGNPEFIEAATIVWAGGIEATDLTRDLSASFASDKDALPVPRGVVVDETLRPVGSDGSIFWIGDAAATSAVPSDQLPPTAQVARSQGEYVAGLFNIGSLTTEGAYGDRKIVSIAPRHRPFVYEHKGSMAYVGHQAAVVDFPSGYTATGVTGSLIWRAFETISQITPQNKLAVLGDFAKTIATGHHIDDDGAPHS